MIEKEPGTDDTIIVAQEELDLCHQRGMEAINKTNEQETPTGI